MAAPKKQTVKKQPSRSHKSVSVTAGSSRKKKTVKNTPRKSRVVTVRKSSVVRDSDDEEYDEEPITRGPAKHSRHRGNVTKIKVVGVGGCGGNVATRLYEEFPRGVEVIAVNTDVQDLEHARAHKKIYIGKQTTKGLGAGMDPELGRQSAEESREEITTALAGADMIFIAAGFGGGTGSGAAPVVAEVAKELGILTIAVVTKPFSFEGSQRDHIAHEAIDRLKERVDTFIIINNDKIFSLIDKDTSLTKAFSVIDGILKNAVVGVAELILSPGVINVDFADIKFIMQHSGPAIIGVGAGSGKERALMAANAALNSPLLETSIDGAKGVLFSVSGRKDIRMNEIGEIARAIAENVDSTAKIIFGTYHDRKVNKGQIKVTLIATGFGSSYGKNYSLFEDFDGQVKNGILFESSLDDGGGGRNGSSIPKEQDPVFDPIQEDNENEKENDDSLWDIPAFLRKKGKRR